MLPYKYFAGGSNWKDAFGYEKLLHILHMWYLKAIFNEMMQDMSYECYNATGDGGEELSTGHPGTSLSGKNLKKNWSIYCVFCTLFSSGDVFPAHQT